jgi:hypothetical protein
LLALALRSFILRPFSHLAVSPVRQETGPFLALRFPPKTRKDAGPKQPSFDPAPGSAFRVIMLLLIGVRWLDILASILWAALFLFEVVIVRPLQAFHNLPRHSKSVV